MIQSAHQVRIRRPLAEVFEFLQEPDHYAQWQIVMEHISATNGVREGSVITYTRTSDTGDHVRSIIKITRNNGRDILESITLGGQFENRVCFRLLSRMARLPPFFMPPSTPSLGWLFRLKPSRPSNI